MSENVRARLHAVGVDPGLPGFSAVSGQGDPAVSRAVIVGRDAVYAAYPLVGDDVAEFVGRLSRADGEGDEKILNDPAQNGIPPVVDGDGGIELAVPARDLVDDGVGFAFGPQASRGKISGGRPCR